MWPFCYVHIFVRWEIEKDLENGPRIMKKREKRPFWLMRLCVRFEIEKDLENGPRVYEKEKKGKKSKSENNIPCIFAPWLLTWIVNEIRVLWVYWEYCMSIHTRIYLWLMANYYLKCEYKMVVWMFDFKIGLTVVGR